MRSGLVSRLSLMIVTAAAAAGCNLGGGASGEPGAGSTRPVAAPVAPAGGTPAAAPAPLVPGRSFSVGDPMKGPYFDPKFPGCAGGGGSLLALDVDLTRGDAGPGAVVVGGGWEAGGGWRVFEDDERIVWDLCRAVPAARLEVTFATSVAPWSIAHGRKVHWVGMYDTPHLSRHYPAGSVMFYARTGSSAFGFSKFKAWARDQVTEIETPIGSPLEWSTNEQPMVVSFQWRDGQMTFTTPGGNRGECPASVCGAAPGGAYRYLFIGGDLSVSMTSGQTVPYSARGVRFVRVKLTELQ